MDKPHTFTPGEYVTRDGRKAVVLCTDAPGGEPIVGYIVQPSERIVTESLGPIYTTTWLQNGAFQSSRESNADLMPPAPAAPEAVVRWVNLWKNGDISHGHLCLGHPNLAARTRVVLTPGQFDTEDTPSEWDRAIDAVIGALQGSDFYPLFAHHVRESMETAIRALKRGSGHA